MPIFISHFASAAHGLDTSFGARKADLHRLVVVWAGCDERGREAMKKGAIFVVGRLWEDGLVESKGIGFCTAAVLQTVVVGASWLVVGDSRLRWEEVGRVRFCGGEKAREWC